LESIDLLVKELNIPLIKIASGEITNAPLLLKAAQTGKPIILSTGMSDLGDIEAALGVLAFGYLNENKKPSIKAFKEAYYSEQGYSILRNKITLLHCTTEYPAPFDEVNLNVMDTLRNTFGLAVGYSDHTQGIAVPIAAVARGAMVIEKHFTLNRNLPGPDHNASIEPDDLKQMVQSIRQVERALGSPFKKPSQSEYKNLIIARKSLVAACEIKKGEKFTSFNINTKRPGNGISPLLFWEWLGKTAVKDYKENEMIGE
jgi:sialic acid synthase SpsE